VEAVVSNASNFSASNYALVPNSGSLPQGLRNEFIDSRFSSPTLSLPSGVSYTDPPKVTIYHTTRKGSPRGLGFSATGNYDFSYHVIDSIGRDQIDASPSSSSSEVIEKVVVLVPTLQGGN
jgi:hypothetical protein